MWWRKPAFGPVILALILSVLSIQALQPLALHASDNAPTKSLTEPSPAGLQPDVLQPIKHDTSPALRDMQPVRVLAQTGPREIPLGPLPKLPKPGAPVEEDDTVVQGQQGPLAMPSTDFNFEGVSNLFGGWPPDTQGDIGANHYVQWINLHFAIWSIDRTARTATLVYGPAPGNTLWQDFGGACETTNSGDPITLYDTQARRWFMSQFALPNFPSDPFFVCIAVSTTGDPTGAWYRYAYEWTNGVGQPVMNDYPKFGVWPDGYYMTVNQFAAGSLSLAGAGVAAFERDQMLQGLPARMVKFDLYDVNPAFGGMLPSDLDGPFPPPAGAPNIFAEVDDGAAIPPNDAMRLWQFHVDWTNPLNSTFGLSGQPNTTLPIANFNPLTARIPQPGTSQTLDSLADRLMHRLAYRNIGDHAALVVNHTVDAGAARSGVRWYEVRDPHGSPVIYQQSTYAPADGLYRWMGSIAMDHNGNAALGYSVSSSTVYPSIRYAGRLASDPPGAMSQGEAQIIAGTGSQTGHYRWGDYSMMGIDPVDDCTFWYTQEYVQTTGSNTWQTRIGAFKFPSCSMGPQGRLAGVISNAVTGTPIVGAQVQATASPTRTVFTTSGANGAYSTLAPVGTYTVTASAYAYQPAQFSGVSVVSGTTTTLNIALTPAALYVVSGTIRDAVTGWPLYASLNIAGYPGGIIWNDPVTGHYSITLAEGIAYTFNVNAGVPGHLPASRLVGPLTGNRTENFALSVNPTTCNAPGYVTTATSIYSQTFEANDGGYTVGGYTSWAWGVPTGGPGSAHSGGKVWATNLAGDYYDSEDGDITSPNIDLSAHTGQVVSVTWWQWLWTESGFDYASLEASNDGGATWTRVYGEVSGNVDLAWARRSVTLDPTYAVRNFRVRFRFRSDGSVSYPGWYVDDVSVAAVACYPQTGGLIVGNVYDANTGSALNGATVTSDLGQTATAFATPADPAIDDAFYALFSPAGAHPVTATMSGGYGTNVHIPTVVQRNAIRQNFNVPAGRLSYAPPSLSATLELGASATRPFTLANTGSSASAFELIELNKGAEPLGPIEKPEFGVKPFRQNFVTAQGLGLPPLPPAPPYAAGDVIQSWSPTGLGTDPWGIAYEGKDSTVWVGEGWGPSDSVIEYAPNGVPTGRAWTHALNPNGPADMAFNFNTGMAWIMNVASPDNCIYEMNPASGFSGAKICPSFSVSQRGLAYDPSTDTYFAGSWADLMIHHFDSAGVILDEVNVGLPIAGLAYNPDTMHLFVMVNNDPNPVYVLDAANRYALVGQFNVGQGFGAYSGAGLEFDCDGNLWAVDQDADTVYQFKSGETTSSMCAPDVPWLSESPISGTLAALTARPIAITFDAGVPQLTQPGQYHAQLKIKEDTPYQIPNVPVTLTVTAPATWGKLSGTVTGLGYCDVTPAPLADATVFIQSGSGMTRTLTTGANGAYQVWLNQARSPLTVTVTAAGYQARRATNVIVTGRLTTTVNFDLRWLRPCLNVKPAQFAVTVELGVSTTLPLTLANTGAASTPFRWSENDRGTQPATPMREQVPGSVSIIKEIKPNDRAAPVAAPFPILTNGGPDGFGYTFKDSNEPDGPLYQWIEIAPPAGGSGTEITGLTGEDDGYFWPIALPFTFNFYGTNYADLAVASNGTLYFQNDYLGLSNTPIPGTTNYDVDTFIAHLWDDLNVFPGAVYYQIEPDRIIVEYYRVSACCNSPDSATWEVILFANGNILFQYQDDTFGDSRNHGASATIGIQGNVTTGLQYSYDTPALSDNLAICFAYPGNAADCSGGDVPWLSEAPITGTIAAGGAQVIAVTFDASVPEVTRPGDYFATLNVISGDPVHRIYAIPITATFALKCVPVAGVNFTYTPTAPKVGEPVTLTGTALTGTMPITYSWNFGDGSAVSRGSPITHLFPLTLTARSYTVTLTAANACRTAQVLKSVKVRPQTFFLPIVMK